MYAVAVTAARERLGTIYVGGLTLSDSDQRTVERAGVVTALVLLFERQAADARQSARNRLVSDLVSARGSREERLSLARTVGFDPQKPFCLLVLRGEEPGGQRALLISASAATGEGSLVGTHDGDVVALVPGTDADGLARAVAARIGKRTCVTVAGVGPVSTIDDIGVAHEEGHRTVGALIALGHRGKGAAATQLGFAGLIVGSDPDVDDYVRKLLGSGPGLRRAARHRPRRDARGILRGGREPAPRRRDAARPCQHGLAAARAHHGTARRVVAAARPLPRAADRAAPALAPGSGLIRPRRVTPRASVERREPRGQPRS